MAGPSGIKHLIQAAKATRVVKYQGTLYRVPAHLNDEEAVRHIWTTVLKPKSQGGEKEIELQSELSPERQAEIDKLENPPSAEVVPIKPTLATAGGTAAITSNRTELTPEEEKQFQTWYAGWAKKAGIDPDPDHPLHKYDYRGAFKEGVEPTISPEDGKYHWPSRFKDDDHPNRFVPGVGDTKELDKKKKEPKKLEPGVYEDADSGKYFIIHKDGRMEELDATP